MNQGVLCVVAGGFLAALAANPAAAQDRCRDTEKFDHCVNRRITGNASGEAADRLHRKTPGLGSGIGGILASAIEDFLARFAGGVAIDREDPKEGILTAFEVNLPASGGAGVPARLGGAVRVRLELREPQLFSPLVEAIPPAERAATEQLVARELDDLDDISISVAWNRESRRFGRSIRANAAVVDGLLGQILGGVPDPPWVTRFIGPWIPQIKADLESTGRDAEPGCAIGTGFDTRMECLSPALRAEFEDSISDFLDGYARYRAAADSAIAMAGYHRIADLINNQPQLNVSGQTRIRDDLVGPREYHVEARYENGWANLNGLRKYCDGEVGVSCYRAYLDEPGVRAILNRSDRIWFSGEIRWIEDYELDSARPEIPLELEVEGSLSITGEAGYGRYLSVTEEGEELARVDLLAKVALHQGARHDTWGVSAIYTHRVSDSFSLPIGVSYSNQDEFLADVDHRVSANMGLHYRLAPASP